MSAIRSEELGSTSLIWSQILFFTSCDGALARINSLSPSMFTFCSCVFGCCWMKFITDWYLAFNSANRSAIDVLLSKLLLELCCGYLSLRQDVGGKRASVGRG